jgi:hypothetical protein
VNGTVGTGNPWGEHYIDNIEDRGDGGSFLHLGYKTAAVQLKEQMRIENILKRTRNSRL